MDAYKKIIILIPVIFLVLNACLDLKQPSNRIDYYTLEYDPPKISDLNPLPLVVRLERFSVAPVYNTNQIIYRDSSFKRNSYVYHKWRANPGDLVTYFLSRDLKESGLFKAVLPYDSRFPSPYMVEGVVEEFFERDTAEMWEAVLTVSIVLMVEREPDISRRILFQKTYRANEACKEKDPMALTGAMSRTMAGNSDGIIRDIYNCLKDRK